MVLTIRIMEDKDDTLENAIYLAAYQNHVNNAGVRVAKWNGTKYEPVNCDAQINAITTFTEVVTVTKTKDVIVSETSKNTTNVFIPLRTLKAEEGMNWNSWLVSDYNTTNETNLTIRNADAELVDLNSTIEAGKEYSFYDAEAPKQAGLYVNGTVTKTWEDLLNDGTLKLVNGVLTSNDKTLAGELIIPNDGSVTSIGDSAFEYHDALTKVSIPDSVKYIGHNAFYSCAGLITIDLGNGVERIESYAFRGCESLLGLTLPDSVTYFNSAGGPFLFCQSFSYINLSANLTEVPLLYGKFDELIIPDGYTNFGWQTLAVIETVYMPETITHFGAEPITGFYAKILGGTTVHFAGTEEQWNQILNVEKIAANVTVIFNSPYQG
jgi:hypothetical protein